MTEPRVRVFSSAARNYLPKVRLLFDSLERFHPDWERTLVLVERDATPADALAANAHGTLCLHDLVIPDWEPWSFCHSLVELATAVKPFALSQLLGRPDTACVLYFDPDMELYSRLDDIVDASSEASILLTPHQLAPEAQLSRVVDNEISSLRHGVFNLGFLAVAASAEGRAFAEWWGQRLYRFCRDDPAQGLFTDQKWIDLVPALFSSVGVLRSPRHNVASWNLSQRSLSQRGGSYYVGDEPLGFYHFTSVSTDSHRLMLLKNSDGGQAVLTLVDDYEQRERKLGTTGRAPWSLACFADGNAITTRQRRLYRDSPELQAKFPQPYDDKGLPQALAARETAADADGAASANAGSANAEINGGLAATAALSSLSLGYGASDDAVDGEKLRRLLRAAATDLRSASMLARRTLTVLRADGLRGVLKRLR